MKFFSLAPDEGLTFHNTASKAQKHAQKAIDFYEKNASTDGWPEDIEETCWGKVIESAMPCNHRPDPDGDWAEIHDVELRAVKSDGPGLTHAGSAPVQDCIAVMQDHAAKLMQIERDRLAVLAAKDAEISALEDMAIKLGAMLSGVVNAIRGGARDAAE